MGSNPTPSTMRIKVDFIYSPQEMGSGDKRFLENSEGDWESVEAEVENEIETILYHYFPDKEFSVRFDYE